MSSAGGRTGFGPARLRAGAVLVPAAALAAGAVAAVFGLELGTGWIASMFVFSCLLVGLAQQTLP